MRYCLSLVLVFLIFDNSISAQDSLSSPYFSFGAFTLDGRSSSNRLDQIEGLFDGFKMGIGYEFGIHEKWGVLAGGDILLTHFDDEYSEEFVKKAWMRINTNALSFCISPRYYITFEDESALFVGALTRLESSGSSARFKFKDKEDIALGRESSGFQFQYGFTLGYRFALNEDVLNSISLNFISRDLGSSINKLELEQSAYFMNETLKKSTSVELEVSFSFPKKRKK